MDIVIKQDTRKRSYMAAGVAMLTIGLVVYVIYKWFNPSIPTVERDRIYTDTVKRGTLVRLVRGAGTIVPRETRFLTTQTQGTITQIHVRPGAEVTKDSVILQMHNPELIRDAFDAEMEFGSAGESLEGAKLELEQAVMALKSQLAELERSKSEAELDLEVNEELFAEGLIGKVELRKSKMLASQMSTQVELERQRLEFLGKSNANQIATKRSELNRAQAKFNLFREQVEALNVRAGIDGVLQRLTVEEGQTVLPSEAIAEVADTRRLKAEIRINEADTKELARGQPAIVDVGNWEIEGVVERIDAAVEEGTVTVDVKFLGDVPSGVRTDLTVEGRIKLEVIEDAVYVGKPTMASQDRSFSVFKISPDGEIASRVEVLFGKGSISTIQVAEGLAPGDTIILSDTTEWDDFDRIRIVDK